MTQTVSSKKAQWPGYVLLALAIALAIAVGMYEEEPEVPEAPPVPAREMKVNEPVPVIPPMQVPPPPPR